MLAQATSVYSLFRKTSTIYEIPAYQRGYAWGKSQIEELLNDVWEAKEADLNMYFLGAITVIRVDRENDFERFSVVDGQQRLITFLLFARAYEKFLEDKYGSGNNPAETEECKRSRSRAELILGRDRNDCERLMPIRHFRSHEEKALRQIVCGKNPPYGELQQHKIIDAYKLIDKWISRLNRKMDSLEEVCKFANYFFDSTYLVRIVTDDEDTSYQIFEVLNNRGQSLTQLDLIRNRTLRAVHERQHPKLDRAHKLWSEALEIAGYSIDKRSIDSFLQHHFSTVLSMLTGKWTETKDLYRALKDKLENTNDPLSLLEKLFLSETSLKAGLTVYLTGGQGVNAFPHETIAENKVAQEQLKRAAQYKVTHPILHALLWNSADAATIHKISALLANYIKRLKLTTSRLPVAKLGTMASEIAHKIHNSRQFTYEDLQTMLSKYDQEKGFNVWENVVFIDKVISNFNIAESAAKEAFIDIVNSKRESAGEVLTRSSSLHLEHIFPREPNFREWPSFADVHLKTHLGRLGNLTILGQEKNIRASNSSYEVKQKIYLNSNYWITREIPKRWPDWTPDAIEDRTKYLAELLATEVWKLDIPPFAT